MSNFRACFRLCLAAGTTAAGLACAHAAAPSFAQQCGALVEKARFSVTFEDAPVTRDNSRSRDELQQLSRHSPAPRHRVYGLTQAQASVRYAMRAALLVDAKGNTCAVPSVDVTLGVRDLKVYLARELDNDCKRAVVDEHEQQHVDVWRDHLRAGARRLEPVLRERLAGVTRHASADAAQQALRARVDEIVKPMLAQLQDEIRDANRLIDSPQSYRATSQQLDACG